MVRKDVERAFGVLPARFAMGRDPASLELGIVVVFYGHSDHK